MYFNNNSFFNGTVDPRVGYSQWLNIKYIPLSAQGMLVKNISNHNALQIETFRFSQARSLRQQLRIL